jgi:hypothetical protein
MSGLVTKKTVEWTDGNNPDNCTTVSLTTDDRNSGHTEAILTLDSFGSDCIEVLESAHNRIVIKLLYGAEGQALLDGLKAVLK